VRSFLPALVALAAAAAGLYAARESSPARSITTTASTAAIAVSADAKAVTRAVEALQVIRTAPEHGLNAGTYHEATLEAALDRSRQSDRLAPDHAEKLTDLVTETNRALLAFGHDVAIGRVSSRRIVPNWESRRVTPDLRQSLDQFENRPLQGWIASVQPQHPEYAALQGALRQLRDQQERGGWPRVPVRLMKPGLSNPAVTALRQRLAASGELADAAITNPDVYDRSLEDAIKRFQDHHGMKATGMADVATIAAMNVPLTDRIRQVELNLERWRWMPDEFGARHFLVNIPAFQLMAREGGQTVRTMRVVVGKPGHETPVFSGDMRTVVFSPYWNVPESIAENETAPAIRSDPTYLARNHIELVRHTKSGSRIVNPDDVNWFDPDDLKDLSFRQRPGAQNALGHVKFLFPNAFNVYLHDTPSGSLFARTERAFSHGCVRVEQADALAAYVLRDQSEWTTAHIKAAMNAGVEKYVQLDEMIPIHIVYFTAWVGEDGHVFFLPDIYGYDAKQATLTK
jgi:murein L,D-transpeptidase YcbB/YkuD